jgi:hypothetical protein
MSQNHEKIREFIAELSGFARTAEETLARIQEDLEGNRPLFAVFESRMFAIRGTARQLELPEIADLAGLGEEIALKAQTAPTRAHVRKCVGALYDALTTIKHLLENYQGETDEEREILVNRLQATLKSLGGARPTVSVDEIEALLNQRG